MVRKVWFQLIDEESRHEFAGTAAASVLTSVDVKDIGDFRNKVHAKFDHTQPRGSDILARVAPFQLKIYANTAAYDAQDPPLNEKSLVGTLGGSKKNALIVEVPTQRHSDIVWNDSKVSLTDETMQGMEYIDLVQINELVALAEQLDDGKVLGIGEILETPTDIFSTAIPHGLYIRQEYWNL